MSTINYLVKNRRKSKIKFFSKPALQRCPQKRGVCIKTLLLSPRKPNSAVRKVAKVRLSNRLIINAYIPGMGAHNLQPHSVVLVRGGRVKDLPGIKYKTIRGKYDLMSVPNRSKARSKYGIKRT